MRVSVIMPVYNERSTLHLVVERVLAVPYEVELICVDDGSHDGSREILAELQTQHSNLRVLLQRRTWERERPSDAGYRRPLEILCSFRMPISNTTRPTIPICSIL
jgi:glycosyltransferase involved in cell wall biosynthesis